MNYGRSGVATAPAAEATKESRLGMAFTRQIAGYGYDHPVCGCVTITTYDHGLSWILRDA
jgi:hypothetical protein